jgi:hypothetical protein
LRFVREGDTVLMMCCCTPEGAHDQDAEAYPYRACLPPW